jgi:hypothetical protein
MEAFSSDVGQGYLDTTGNITRALSNKNRPGQLRSA